MTDPAVFKVGKQVTVALHTRWMLLSERRKRARKRAMRLRLRRGRR